MLLLNRKDRKILLKFHFPLPKNINMFIYKLFILLCKFNEGFFNLIRLQIQK